MQHDTTIPMHWEVEGQGFAAASVMRSYCWDAQSMHKQWLHKLLSLRLVLTADFEP
jgi:hypothetical protein